MIIYKVTNLINGKLYIGKTIRSLKDRIRQHQYDAKRNRVKNSLLHKSIRKYGINNFSFEIIYNAISIEDMNCKEIFYISYYNSFNRYKGYNLTNGGDGSNGYKFSDEYKKKKKELCNTEEFKDNFKQLMKEYRDSDEYKQRLNERKKKREEEKEKIKQEKKIVKEENKKIRDELRSNERVCPICDKVIKCCSYYYKVEAEKKGSVCKECSIKINKEYYKSVEFSNKVKQGMDNMSKEAYDRMIQGGLKGNEITKNKYLNN